MSLKIDIQSVSDVITNSSTEIFITFDRKEMEKTIKDLINAVFEASLLDCKFDDFFTIETHWYGEEDYADFGYQTKEEFVKYLDENDGWTDDNADYGVSCYYVVKAKGRPNGFDTTKIAELLNTIQKLFDAKEYYG